MPKEAPAGNLVVSVRGNRTVVSAPRVHVDIRMPRPLWINLRKIQAKKGWAMTATCLRLLEDAVDAWEEKYGKL